MQGKLRKNSAGQWQIVDQVDDRVGSLVLTLSVGDVIDIYSHFKGHWVRTRVIFDGREYVAASGDFMFIGQPARWEYLPRNITE